MANMWEYFKESIMYLLKGPGSITSSHTSLLPIQVAPPALKTSLIFESHIQEAGKGFSKNPQTISSAWDERRMWGDQARVWGGLTLQERKLIMLDIYLNNPWISACIDVIAKRIFSGGYVVEKIDEEAPDNAAHEDQMHEFALRINPDWDFNQLGRALITDKLIFGECYSETTWKAGQPWQLFKIDCPTMGYQANRYGQIEQFYQEMEWSRERFFYDPKNIIRWWFPHPRASIDPFAPAEKVTDAVLLDKKMTTWMLTFFQKGTKFPFSVEGVGDQDEADRFLQFFRQNFTGEKNAHAPFVTWGNAKLVWNAAQKLDMDFQMGLDRMRTIIFAAYGVPPAAVSIIESGNIGGGTGEDQDKSLIFNACDPVKHAFFEKLNDRIVRRGMGITDYRYNTRYAEYRSDESIAKVEDMRLKNGSRTINEIRVEGGKRPYDKDQGGDVPFIWSSKEITPVPRLGDLEAEQKQNAQLALQQAAAAADLAQTKAKQAKEPPPPVPPALLPPGQQQPGQQQPGQQQNQNNVKQPEKPAQANKKQQKQASGPQGKQQEAVTLLDLMDQATESQVNTGAMVALMIPPEIGEQIAIAGGEPIEDLHITLAFLGETSDIDPERLPLLRQELSNIAQCHYSLSGRIAGLGRFDAPEGQPDPIIALPDIPGLPELRQALVSGLHDILVPANNEHGYTPHITLAYIEKSAPMPVKDVPNLDLYFDQICLVLGDERFFFPLLGQKSESDSHIESTSPIPDNLWVRPDIDTKIQELAAQGVVSITWGDHPGSCDMCHNNNGVTVKLSETFPSGHQLAPAHPRCVCSMLYTYADGHTEIEKSMYDPDAAIAVNDPDITQKLPVVRKVRIDQQ